jgi:hypothetical protein
MDFLANNGEPPTRNFIQERNETLEAVNEACEKRSGAGNEKINDIIAEEDLTSPKTWLVSRIKEAQRLDTRQDHYERINDYSFALWSKLSSKKIEDAAGRRKEEDDQKKVMGISAPEVRLHPELPFIPNSLLTWRVAGCAFGKMEVRQNC